MLKGIVPPKLTISGKYLVRKYFCGQFFSNIKDLVIQQNKRISYLRKNLEKKKALQKLVRSVTNYWDRLPSNFHVFGTFKSTKDSLTTDYYSRHSDHISKAMFPCVNSPQCPWATDFAKPCQRD